MLTPESEMKWKALRPSKNKFYFKNADSLISFAELHGMKVTGHTLVWDNKSLPSWVVDVNYSRTNARALLKDHITNTVRHFKNKIYCWDVINELISVNGKIRTGWFWYKHIGPEFIDLAFQWAHEADSNALLFYNQWGADGINDCSDGVYKLIKNLLKRGVPIHGVGLQMHLSLDPSQMTGVAPDSESVKENIKRFSDLGLEVHISEMDIQLQNSKGSIEEKFERQAKLYEEILETALDFSSLKAIVFWGVSDQYSWIPPVTGKEDYPLLLDENYKPKPAYFVLADLLKKS